MGAKFIFTVGGVYSGTGKGVASASIAYLLQKRGSKVQMIKCDPYLNVNAGTMNPRQHGEVFLCDDGSETDLDLGTYERIAGIKMSRHNILTSGTLHQELLRDVEDGKYLGQTIQMIPHVTDLIKDRITALGRESDIVIVEIGGTVGDMESEAFYDAARQMKQSLGDDVLVIMVAPIIWNAAVKESKTKPLQNAVKALLMRGVQPDILLCRTDLEQEVGENTLDKIATQTGVDRQAIFLAPQVRTIYEVSIEFWANHLDDLIADKFHLRRKGCQIHKHLALVDAYLNGEDFPAINIGIVGKYNNCDEAYQSLKEAITHAAVVNNAKFVIRWINAEELEEGKDNRSVWRHFSDIQGVIVPGGFDIRGVEGKIRAIEYVREKKIPFLGICLGLQCAVIEFARNVLGLEGATSEEFDKTAAEKVIHYIDGQAEITKKSGTMRLGAYDCELEKDSLAFSLYRKKTISERHRHRYEVNQKYLDQFAKKGFRVVGKNPQTGLVEIMELDPTVHPFFLGTQSHPEFKSRLDLPSPLFDGLMKAALACRSKANQES